MTRIPFRRSPDRRTQSLDISFDRRKTIDRRKPGLDRAALFRGIDARTIDDVINDCELLVLAPGAPLLKLGETNDCVYILLSGELATFINGSSDSGTGFPIYPGESVGEMSAIDGKPTSALVIAVVESRILRVTPDVFWNRVSAIPGVARNLLVALSERLRRNSERMLEAQRKQLALEYLQQELTVAHQLQSTMLPPRGPLFPHRHDIAVEGLMDAATEVGGDLFDAFFVDEKRLFFCIGDVSGHGIPAALFMARTVGLMRVIAMTTSDPALLLERINDQLSVGNDANIFVTLLCGLLDTETGRLIYSNGGHLPPVLVTDGRAEYLPLPKGSLVGAIGGLKYSSLTRDLEKGATVLCITDGVSEATSDTGEEFGDARLIDVVHAAMSDPLSGLISKVRQEVARYRGTEVLEDDCTILALRRL